MVSDAEKAEFLKGELKKQSISIYVGLLQGIGVIIYSVLRMNETIKEIDWFYAFIFSLVALCGTFIFVLLFNFLALLKKIGNKVEERQPAPPQPRRTRPISRQPVRQTARREANTRKRERAFHSDTPYDEDDIPPPDDEDYEDDYEEEPAPKKSRRRIPEDRLLE